VGQLGSFDPWGRKTRAGFHARRRDRGLRIAKFSACAIPVDRETKNHLTIDQLSPRLIALLARSADSLPTSLTAGKNVARFAPIGGAVDSASLVDPSDPRPERAWRLRAAAPKESTEGGTLWTCRTRI
jgi:hypothetical protein